MASLTGNSIATSYNGLLKITDNAAISGTQKNITDGEGNTTPLSMSSTTLQVSATNIELVESTGGNNVMNIDSTKINFEGAVDFTNATVTGIGAPGLVNGIGTGSGLLAIKSADALNTTPSVTTSGGDIALGENARTTGEDNFGRSNIAIGTDSLASSERGVALGYRAESNGSRSISIGEQATSSSARSIAIGQRASATNFRAINIGDYGSAQQSGSISIGGGTQSRAENCITIGTNALVDDSIRVDTVCLGANTKAAQYSTALGAGAYAVGDYAISIGDANTFATGAIAIGDQAQSFTNGAAVIGRNLTAVAWNDSTTVNQLAFANVANLNFADQAAAVAGGVPTGGLYHTDGTVKIVY